MTHEELARNNLRLASQAPTWEWTITMLYYAAVHAVNHAISPREEVPSDFRHQGRMKFLRTHWPRETREAYGSLEDLSYLSRYYPSNHPMTQEQVQEARQLAESVFQEAGIALEHNHP